MCEYRSWQVVFGLPEQYWLKRSVWDPPALYCYHWSRDSSFTSDSPVLTDSSTFFVTIILPCGFIVDREQTWSIRMFWCIDRCIIRFCPFWVRLSTSEWYSSDRIATRRCLVSLFLLHFSPSTFYTSDGIRRRALESQQCIFSCVVRSGDAEKWDT